MGTCIALEQLWSLSPGFDVVEEVVPALVDLQERPVDLGLLGLVTGQQQLLAQLLQVALILTEQVDFLHAILWKNVDNMIKKKNLSSAD